ncbi:hypothetical protein H4R34_001264 [Dimargaris verticillata]|uniref:COP9 signalosome complex subunit 3 n=1 Tax=Dimargaris verticillata TaxID=2761393 RepID=A0A9W8BBS0_9FUNG|nr:hypothetical protein H4R34_001264 [Dimargaris verticillata]
MSDDSLQMTSATKALPVDAQDKDDRFAVLIHDITQAFTRGEDVVRQLDQLAPLLVSIDPKDTDANLQSARCLIKLFRAIHRSDSCLPKMAEIGSQFLQWMQLPTITTLHAQVVEACYHSRQWDNGTRVIDRRLKLGASKDDLFGVHTFLRYHYYAALTLLATQSYDAAEHYLLMCLVAPTAIANDLQVKAYRKLFLTRLITQGAELQLPQIVPPAIQALPGALNNVYVLFGREYVKYNLAAARDYLYGNEAVFAKYGDGDLVSKAVDAIPRHLLKRISQIYTRQPVSDIVKLLKLPVTVEHCTMVYQLVQQMVHEQVFRAEIQQGDDYSTMVVSFASTQLAKSSLSPASSDKPSSDNLPETTAFAEINRVQALLQTVEVQCQRVVQRTPMVTLTSA